MSELVETPELTALKEKLQATQAAIDEAERMAEKYPDVPSIQLNLESLKRSHAELREDLEADSQLNLHIVIPDARNDQWEAKARKEFINELVLVTDRCIDQLVVLHQRMHSDFEFQYDQCDDHGRYRRGKSLVVYTENLRKLTRKAIDMLAHAEDYLLVMQIEVQFTVAMIRLVSREITELLAECPESSPRYIPDGEFEQQVWFRRLNNIVQRSVVSIRQVRDFAELEIGSD